MQKHHLTKINSLALIVTLSTSLVSCKKQPDEHHFSNFTGTRGCVIEQLTNQPYDEFQFQGVSPNHQWLAYAWTNGEDTEGNPIRGANLLNLLTGEQQALPQPINNSGSFSADGKLLTGAQNTADERTDIYEHNLESGEFKIIAANPAWDFLSSYSPDGQSILFNSARSGNYEIYLYARNTESLQQLTNFTGYDANAEFSPDGSKIIFNRMLSQREEGGYDFDIYTYEMATKQETRLTLTPYEESYPSWAPDGQTFVFSSDINQQPELRNLYLMHPNGNTIQLTGGDWKDSYAYWTRDGRYIYFNSDRNGNSDIYRLQMNGLECITPG